jgi:enoyl-CoA hydratase
MNYTSILIETRGRVGLITLNRPQALNALNNQLMTEVMSALEVFDKDDNIGAMVITGSEKAFAAGADIKEMADKNTLQMMDADHVAVFGRIRTIQKPIIAAVSGWALGAGCELPLSCDMIIASDTAQQPYAHRARSSGLRIGESRRPSRRLSQRSRPACG